MTDRFRITLGQLNPVVGDISGNAGKALELWEIGRAEGADLVALPEMFVTGYNAQDLVSKPAFHQAAIEAIRDLAERRADGPELALGGPWTVGPYLFNAHFLQRGGNIARAGLKQH